MSEAETNVKKQIEKARVLHAALGAACLADPEVGGLLVALDLRVKASDSFMVSSGVAMACGRCAEATGSCCFKEMGESYGFIELLANRLLGAELPRERELPGGCFFVGKKGCTLKTRHSFCLNYFCPELIAFLGEKTVLELQRQVGEQLSLGWELERALTRYITRSIPERL
ncbi:MAG: hypothetical protein P4L43_14590 [Syntrophobacteraceae bacterium]|nr:hypothetical protein [Syntrophobacteraceae bacterium]